MRRVTDRKHLFRHHDGGKWWKPLVDLHHYSLTQGRMVYEDPFETAFGMVQYDDSPQMIETAGLTTGADKGNDPYIDYSVPAELPPYVPSAPPEREITPSSAKLALEYVCTHPFPTSCEDLMRKYGWNRKRAYGALRDLEFRRKIRQVDYTQELLFVPA